jgi:ABC-type nitrate/sulfonate/bicarbonate transport system ATPase subunit
MHLESKNLSFTYPGSSKAVIKNLSFSMYNAGFNGLFGPSGIGKTSLARIIANPDSCSGGQILTKEIDTVLYSYNLERLPGWSSIGRHLDKVTPDKKQPLKDKLVDIFELKDILGSRFANLSMGQQNRINLIRYMLQEFDLLIMDESLANVDENLREIIIHSIKELFCDKMFLYISHNLTEVAKLCSQILVFGKASENRSSTIINGLDLKKGEHLDRQELDRTMLEIMNAA